MTETLFGGDDDAATPLTPGERLELIPAYITLRRELNEVEQIGIADADRWAFARRRDVLDETFLKRLHQRMFGTVWRWAGQQRTSARNIGVEAYRIAPELYQLISDVRYQMRKHIYVPDEIAVRFHHRLVFIHAFPNGNGRHARLAADLLAVQLGQPRFSWGRTSMTTVKATRATYVAALRSADGHDIAPLLKFARS